MSTPHELQRELAEHAAGLRSMARDLVRDPFAADDLVQDTIHRALTRDLKPGPLGGWLRRTLLNFTRQWRRGERRRVTREACASPPEPSAGPEDTTSRRETLRAVTDAVLALDEPYQSAVFLRYFEDLPPRTIAKRTQTNIATVKSRLQRGLIMLRARLDRQSGRDRRQWRLALLSSFGLPATAAAPTITLTTGTLLMGTTTKTLLAAGIVGGIGLCLYGLGEDPTPAREEVATTEDADAAGVTTGTDVAGKEQLVREAALPPEAIPSWLDHPFTHELDVRVLNRFGLPIANHTLQLGPANCSLNRASVHTDATGHALVSWPARRRAGTVVVRDETGALYRVPVQHGAKAELTLSGRSGETVQALFETGGTLTLSRYRTYDFSFSHRSGTAPTMERGMHPHALFLQAQAGDRPGPGSYAFLDLATTARVSTTRYLEVSQIESRVLQPVANNLQTANISGTVFGANGKPASKVRVTVLGEGGNAVSHGQSDDNGLFLIEGLAAANYTVRAGGCSQGLGTCNAETTTGTTPVTVHLSRGATIRGRAETAGGKPIAKARITWRAADGSWCDETTTGPDGSFLLANLPGVAGTVMVWVKGRPFPVAVAQDVLCNTPDLLLLDESATGRVIVEPAIDEQLGKAVEIRVWSEDTGIGAKMQKPKKGEPRAISRLPAGWYRVELLHPSTGLVDAGRHWVDGKSDCHLGQVIMPKPAIARLAIEGPSVAERKLELYRVRPDLDVRVALKQPTFDQNYLLEPGDYVLFWVDANDKVRFERFSARAGKELTVRIPR